MPTPRLTFRNLALIYVVAFAATLAFALSPSRHQHVVDGVEVVHAHGYAAPHQHADPSPGSPSAPDRSSEEEAPSFVGFAGSGFGMASSPESVCAAAFEVDRTRLVELRPTATRLSGPREIRGPPLSFPSI